MADGSTPPSIPRVEITGLRRRLGLSPRDAECEQAVRWAINQARGPSGVKLKWQSADKLCLYLRAMIDDQLCKDAKVSVAAWDEFGEGQPFLQFETDRWIEWMMLPADIRVAQP